MSQMSNWLENQLANVIFRTLAAWKPTALYVSLHTASPGESGSPTNEVVGGSYGRVQVGPGDAYWSAVASGTGLTDNVSAIVFSAPTADWGVITHFGVWDQQTNGNLLVYGQLTQSKEVLNNDPAPQFAAGALDVTFA